MKKFFAILFAAVYITLTSGVALNLHYCMGKLASVDLQSDVAEICNKCKKPAKNMDCCQDLFKFCKVTESHHAAPAIQQDFSIAAALQLPVKVLPEPAVMAITERQEIRPHGPPDIRKVPIFLQNCTFLI
ncbi:hypothetical protein [Chitinophaga sp. Cy-1792]|uniref:HYC_CC_PP family protein n=1 Tax=Chitinophaga sp. Cy-1792 TaxID=2608339 RepID=UPI00142116AA|nr:hypothetical protein [Chitinophaga sp. Cy-1792]NIG53470.1 hypothetical protein [Chitinophaga sp. Cy-1792]